MGETERFMPTHIVAAAGIVVNSNGEILLVKNNRRGWEFPGGQVEVSENVIDAVKREIMESWFSVLRGAFFMHMFKNDSFLRRLPSSKLRDTNRPVLYFFLFFA